MMDDRPQNSIWGTIITCVEIGLCIYEITTESENGGVMIPSELAKLLLSESALNHGKENDGFLHFDKQDSAKPINELIEIGYVSKEECDNYVDTPYDYGAFNAYDTYGFFEHDEESDELEL